MALVLLAPLAVASCGGGSRLDPGPAAVIECAPYARQLSGLQLYGDAAAWWDQAAGRYRRGHTPARGSVLVFRATPRLPAGHVSVVAGQRGPREILVDQANWVHSHIGRQDPVVDVSPDNDWTQVRVWWAPTGQLGATVYPTFGFVGPGAASDAVSSIMPEPRSERIAAARASEWSDPDAHYQAAGESAHHSWSDPDARYPSSR